MTSSKTFPPKVWVRKSTHEGVMYCWDRRHGDDTNEYISLEEHLHFIKLAKASGWAEAAKFINKLVSSNEQLETHCKILASWLIEKATKLREESEGE